MYYYEIGPLKHSFCSAAKKDGGMFMKDQTPEFDHPAERTYKCFVPKERKIATYWGLRNELNRKELSESATEK